MKRSNILIVLTVLIMSGILVSSPAPAQESLSHPFNEGLQLYYQKRFKDSAERFMEALETDPLNSMALSFYLSARYRDNELIQAVNRLEQRSIEGGETPVLKAHLGIGYFTRGLLDPNMMEESLIQFREALSQNNDLSIANTGMGMVYYQKRLIPRAKGYFINAIRSNPKDIMALERAGEILMVDDNNYEQALDFFNQIITMAPHYSDGYFYAGSAYQRMENTPKAIEYFKKTMELDPMGTLKGYDAPLRIGDIYLAEENWNEAEKYFKKSLAINPDNPYAQSQLKRAQAKGQEWEGEKIDSLKIKDKLDQ